MITGINELKTLTRYISWNVNVNLMEKIVSQINGGIIIMTEAIPTNFNKKKATYKMQKFIYFTSIFINSLLMQLLVIALLFLHY